MNRIAFYLACLMAGVGLAISADYTPVTEQGQVAVSKAKAQTFTAATNSLSLTITNSLIVITSGTNPANETNIVTCSSATDGQRVTVVNSVASTNMVLFADAGYMRLAGDWLGGPADSISLVGVGTNWIETGRSNN